MAEVHNHGIDPSCRERLVGECLLKPGVVVLDPGPLLRDFGRPDGVGAGELREYAAGLEDDGRPAGADLLRNLADQIEAQTKPPRIPEPGKYGVVKASAPVTNAARYEWTNEGRFWRSLLTGDFAEWSALIDPVLVRPGVDD